MKRRIQASYTVEAALLMSIILPILIIMLNMTFFLCDSVRMRAVMQEKARQQLEEAGDPVDDSGFLCLHPGCIQVETNAVRVKVSAKDVPDRQIAGEEYEGEVKIIRRYPHTWIRIIRGMQAEED